MQVPKRKRRRRQFHLPSPSMERLFQERLCKLHLRFPHQKRRVLRLVKRQPHKNRALSGIPIPQRKSRLDQNKQILNTRSEIRKSNRMPKKSNQITNNFRSKKTNGQTKHWLFLLFRNTIILQKQIELITKFLFTALSVPHPALHDP